MRVIGVDPSLRGTGYAVLERDGQKKIRCLTYGVVNNRQELSQSGCLVAIHERIADVLKDFTPECAAVEGIIYVQSMRTAITLGAARGASLLALAQKGIPIYEYAPRRVKQSVVGKGAAQKAQVGFMVRVLLELAETPPPDAADAMAIALTHLQTAARPAALIKAAGQEKL